MINAKNIKNRIENLIKKYARARSSRAYSLVPSSLTSGKLYEAHVLSLLLERLYRDEEFEIVLINTNYIPLKSAPGPINPRYPHFDLYKEGSKIAELWTDIEFLTFSYSRRNSSTPTPGDFHELDLLIVDSGISGRPRHDNIWLGVECKNTGYNKNLLKEILGIRRELSLLSDPEDTRFSRWPRTSVPANPPSCLLVFSTDAAVASYSNPGAIFGIDFFHEEI
jgi:hypothetical protein